MQVEGVNAVSVSSGGATAAPAQSGDINPTTNVGDSSNSNNNIIDSESDLDSQESAAAVAGPKPLKSMATSDFLSLHNNAINSQDNVMNKMMKILEAVLALKLLDETLEAAQGDKKGNNFKEIA
jgi:hypothetical protein